MTEHLQKALAEAATPSIALMLEAFDAIHGQTSPLRDRMLKLMEMDAWWDAARMLVPPPWRLCVSEQVPGGAWAALALRPGSDVRFWQHHGRAKVVPHAIAVAALVRAEAPA